MMRIRILLTALVLLLPLQVLAQSRIWSVSPSGSDLGGGSAGGPFATIQRAIDAASPGDTVEVQPGHYAGPGQSGSGLSCQGNLRAEPQSRGSRMRAKHGD